MLIRINVFVVMVRIDLFWVNFLFFYGKQARERGESLYMFCITTLQQLEPNISMKGNKQKCHTHTCVHTTRIYNVYSLVIFICNNNGKRKYTLHKKVQRLLGSTKILYDGVLVFINVKINFFHDKQQNRLVIDYSLHREKNKSS